MVDFEMYKLGNWVYFFEKMFFEVMKRKGYDVWVVDMKIVVLIYNVVNERVWDEIKKWEVFYFKDLKYVLFDSFCLRCIVS